MPTVTMVDMSAQKEANLAKEVVIAALVAEGYLTGEQAQDFLSKYAVVLRGRSWFGRMMDKLRGEIDVNCCQYEVARLVDLKFTVPLPEKKD
jgi:hypothetical protein